MTLMKARHSVRSYTNRKIEPEIKNALLDYIIECNQQSGLHIQACFDEPDAMNQQKFLFTLRENEVEAKALSGFYTDIDLGIVKYHFELSTQGADFQWKTNRK